MTDIDKAIAPVTVTSKKYWLNAKDFLKGMFIAIGTSVFTVVQTSLDAGQLVLNWKTIITVALAASVTYLLKNFFTPASVQKVIPNSEVADVKAEVKETSAK